MHVYLSVYTGEQWVTTLVAKKSTAAKAVATRDRYLAEIAFRFKYTAIESISVGGVTIRPGSPYYMTCI